MMRWAMVGALLAVASGTAASTAPARASAPAVNRGEPLTGTWSGSLSGSGVRGYRIVIVVNAHETGGSWRISATCHGPLTLDTISNGYHHYRRKLAPGATCAGGDVDCLKPAGANLYDAVTSHLGGAHGSSGTLRRVSSR